MVEDLSGKTIRGYELHELIGVGGFGAVYRATQTVVGREVVIKIILPQYASQPEFIRRFEAEAKLVARLEHLHIVSLYDYWREPSGAYLVMRFLRGGSLRDSLRANGAWSPKASARLVAQIGAALTIAHRNNVVHRDVKPANILLDEENNAYLTDFGIAVDLIKKGGAQAAQASTASGGVTGSAGYISPEQINVKPATARSDIYSMGILMYELLTGIHPFHDAKSAIALFIKHSSEPVPPMEGFPAIIEDVILKATAKDPEERYPDMLTLAKAFREAVIEADMPERAVGGMAVEDFDTSAFDLTSTAKIGEVQNPYKGLRAFQEGDADDFHGREALIDRLLARMDEDHTFARFLAVVGPSGSGKSSVVKAGLLPALRRGMIEDSEDWYIVEMLPGVEPLEELQSALLRVAVNPVENIEERLAQRDQLASIVAQALPDYDSELVLVIDQFEEVFTQSDEEERDIFLQNLYNAIVDTNSRLRVIITLRADFYDRPLMVQNFSALIQQRTEVVVPLSVDELERAITTPARAVKVFFQQGLSAQIVSEVSDQPGVLPMLQYALTELFERREGQLLTVQAYNEIGGVLGALARRAEEIYVDMTEAQQDASRQLFLRLVTLGEGSEDTRRRALQSELVSAAHDADVMEEVIGMYGQYRLLTFDRDPQTRTPTVEVAHEALIREWQRLRDWLDSSRSDVRLQRLLAHSAQEWQEANRDASFLLRGGRLIQFEEWARNTNIAMTALETEYLQASVAERERAETEEEERIAKERELERRARQRLRLIVATLALASVAGILLSVGIFNASQDAVNNAETATFAQGEAIVQANNAQTQAAIAAIAQGEAESQANIAQTQVALVSTAQSDAENQANIASTAESDALAQANIASTAESDALAQANIASTAEQDALAQANFAQTQVALVSTAQSDAESQANIASTAESDALAQANIASTAEQDALAQANIAQTQVALVSTAQADAQSQANIASTAESDALAQANIAGTQAAIASTAENDAVIAAQNAEREAEIANSLALAASANQLADTNSPLALRLAIEANSIENPSLEAQRALLDVVFNAPRRLYEGTHGAINAVVMAQDGTIAYTANADGTISQWDVELAEQVATLEGHTDLVNELALSRDETRIISAGREGNIIIWDANTGEIINRIPNVNDAPVNTVAFSPGGNNIVSGDVDGNTIVWDLQGNVVDELGGTNAINSVAYNNDGTYVLIASDNGARLWNVGSGSILALFDDSIRIDRIRDAVFAPDNPALVLTTGGITNPQPRIWEWETVRQTLVQELPAHNSPINSVTFSPDGALALSASDDFVMILSDAATGAELRRFVGHTNRINDATFSPDGRFILSAAGDGTMFLWDTSPSGEERRLDGHDLSISDLTYLDENTILSSADDGRVKLWDAETGDVIQDIQVSNPSVPQTTTALRPTEDDSLQIIWAATEARLVDVRQNSILRTFTLSEERSWIQDLIISNDGNMLLTGGGYFFRNNNPDFTRAPLLYQWDIESGALIRTFSDERFEAREGLNQSVTSLAFSPNERFIASGMEDGRIFLWDVREGTLIQEYIGHSDQITTLDFTSDGNRLLSGSVDRTILLWNVSDGQLLRRYSGHTGAIRSVRFSSDETQLLSGSEDTRMILWDINTGQPLRTFSGQDAPITSVDFTPDGQFALSGAVDGSMWVWGIGNSGDVLEYANDNRYIPELTCNQREQYRVQPLCEVATGE
jgi:WD40 repeat protein/tRNA A-37 threonylcarbamoyl transferase component Bud32